jgi:hypothetical protein
MKLVSQYFGGNMTDWDMIVDQVQAAMLALDKAHTASESLREKTDRETMENFQVEIKQLTRHLEQIQNILAHEDTYTMDELADALGAAMGNKTTYHRIPHYDVLPKK